MLKRTVLFSLEDTLRVLNEFRAIPEVMDIITSFRKAETDMFTAVKTNPFIVVEGLDASGKSTVCQQLAKSMNGVHLSTPGPTFLPYRAFFDKQNERLRRAYYCLSNYAVAEDVKRALQEQPVILDRFFYSTASYSLALQDDLLCEDRTPVCCWPQDLLCPQVVLFLHVDEKTRCKRHENRATTNTFEEHRLANDEVYRKKLCRIFMKFKDPEVTVLDANGPVETVVENCLEIIKLKQYH